MDVITFGPDVIGFKDYVSTSRNFSSEKVLRAYRVTYEFIKEAYFGQDFYQGGIEALTELEDGSFLLWSIEWTSPTHLNQLEGDINRFVGPLRDIGHRNFWYSKWNGRHEA